MAKKSVKENKNVYQLKREELGYSREKAAEVLGYVTADRIYTIEHDDVAPHPDEVLAMAEGYKDPSLCNYFCSHDCPIGREYVPEVKQKDLSTITLEILDALNKLDREKNRLIEITIDGEVSQEELSDFVAIQKELDKMALVIDSLNLWIGKAVADGKLDKVK